MQRYVEVKALRISSAPVAVGGVSRSPAGRRRRQTVQAGPRSQSYPRIRVGLLGCAILLLTLHFTPVSSPPPPVSVPPQSWLAGSTLLTVYGRGFGTAPVLGRLGMDHNMSDVSRQVQPYVRAIQGNAGTRHVRIAIHLIYGLATPCAFESRCLLYLDDTGVNIVKRYIEPAARRGWLVILDDQLGRSNPLRELHRMIAKGYLRYDNVGVAFDPEFRTARGQADPGVPTGYVTARQLNVTERALGRYCATLHLAHRKLMLVHQWAFGMIRHRRALRTRMPYVDPVIVMDAIGGAAVKAQMYDDLLGGHAAPRWRGIKLFPPNPYELAGHIDEPMLSWRQVFGRSGPATGPAGAEIYLRPVPNVIVMT